MPNTSTAVMKAPTTSRIPSPTPELPPRDVAIGGCASIGVDDFLSVE